MQPLAKRFGLRWFGREDRIARDYIRKLNVRPTSVNALVGSLSGGNQQKVAIARALLSRPRLLLVEEPTQGVDVAAKAEIHALLKDVAREQGCAVVVASSEFEELLSLCSTINVMSMGSLVKRFAPGEASYQSILEHALP